MTRETGDRGGGGEGDEKIIQNQKIWTKKEGMTRQLWRACNSDIGPEYGIVLGFKSEKKKKALGRRE